jgi:diaminopropionate ammonia-lyase
MRAVPHRRWFTRPAARAWRCPPAPAQVLAFHQSLPGYAPTPLVELAALAAELGVGRVFVKDESSRFGLPAFKALGASWAIHRVLRDRTDHEPALLVTATEGNHGRAVARVARDLGQRALVFVPRGVHPAAVDAIVEEGATVVDTAGDCDTAVARAAAAAAHEPGAVLVQDAAWAGYETIPGYIVEGYSTLLREVDAQLTDQGAAADLVLVPVGVGSLVQAVITHYRSGSADTAHALVSVEPDTAACALTSLRTGAPTSVATGETVMAGLNCGTLSSLAWPYLAGGLDAAVAVTDADAATAAADLAALGVQAGPCGAASLAGARAALLDPAPDSPRAALPVDATAVVVLLSTEGRVANASRTGRRHEA